MANFVVVRVWVSRIADKSPGHASLAIRPHAKLASEGYVSFGPRKDGSIYGPGMFYDWHHDAKKYKTRGVWIGRIYGLDQDGMLNAFHRDHHSPQTYSLAQECATMVHRYLSKGGGDELATRWSRNVFAFWSPDDVEDYARSIVDQTNRLGSTGHKIHGDGTIKLW